MNMNMNMNMNPMQCRTFGSLKTRGSRRSIAISSTRSRSACSPSTSSRRSSPGRASIARTSTSAELNTRFCSLSAFADLWVRTRVHSYTTRLIRLYFNKLCTNVQRILLSPRFQRSVLYFSPDLGTHRFINLQFNLRPLTHHSLFVNRRCMKTIACSSKRRRSCSSGLTATSDVSKVRAMNDTRTDNSRIWPVRYFHWLVLLCVIVYTRPSGLTQKADRMRCRWTHFYVFIARHISESAIEWWTLKLWKNAEGT